MSGMAGAHEVLRRLTDQALLQMLSPSSAPFQQDYLCFPVTSSVDKSELENGDKVILPPSALRRLASSDSGSPMLFELQNPATYCTAHCGVQEFTANEGTVLVPYWIMEDLLLEEGDIVRVKAVKLPKGTYVKIQPQQKGFLNVRDPEAVLKSILTKFSCLTVGQSIVVAHDDKEFTVDILETKPEAAICIIDTDCEVEVVPTAVQGNSKKVPEIAVALHQTKVPSPRPSAPNPPPSQILQAAPKRWTNQSTFQPFSGPSRRLNEKSPSALQQQDGVTTSQASNSTPKRI